MTMIADHLTGIEKFEADLWKIADDLRANSGLASNEYFMPINRRADLVCFVNGLPLVFIELKAVYKNIRAGFEGNLRDYMDENVIAHAFHHNAFLIVSNGDRARYGSITSEWRPQTSRPFNLIGKCSGLTASEAS